MYILEKLLIQIYFFKNESLQEILSKTEEKILELFSKFEYLNGSEIGTPEKYETNEEILKLRDVWNEIIYPKMKQYYEIILPKIRILVLNIIDYVYNYKRAFNVNYLLKRYSYETNYNDDIYIRNQCKVQKEYHDKSKKMRDKRINLYQNYMKNMDKEENYFRKIKEVDYDNNKNFYQDYFKKIF